MADACKIHGNDLGIKGELSDSALPKTVFDREAEPLGLSVATGAAGVELHRDRQPVVPPDGFPDHYLAKASRVQKLMRKAWRGANMPKGFTPGFVLARVYEAVGGIGYHMQFLGERPTKTTGDVLRFFQNPARWRRMLDDLPGSEMENALLWPIGVCVHPEGVRMFSNTAEGAAATAIARDETGSAMREAVLWLVFLDELVTNPYRSTDAQAFISYCVRKIEERAGGAST